MPSKARAALALLTCVTSLAACGENADQRAAGQTVTRFYEALKRHEATTACGLMSPAVARAMLKSLGQHGKPCAAGLDAVFRRVDSGTSRGFFDELPTVDATLVKGDRATVIVHRGYQRRRIRLTRVGDAWQITGSPVG